MLLFFQLFSLSSFVLSSAQFFGGPVGGHSGLSLSPYGGMSETLPISQHELAQLMAQSLATSRGKNYGSPFVKQNENSEDSEDFGSNYETNDGNSQQEEDNERNNEDVNEQTGYDQQEVSEGSPYQQQQQHAQHGQHGQSEGAQEGSDERENDGYDNSGSNYQGEGENLHNQQYPTSHGSYGSPNSEDQHSGTYDESQGSSRYESSRLHPFRQMGSNVNQNPGIVYRGHIGESAVHPGVHPRSNVQFSNDYSYSAPGSGYSGPGSESSLKFVVINTPKSMGFRN